MKIAVACDGLTIAPSLFQCSSYMCYTVVDGRPVDCRNIPAMDQPLDKLADFFHAIEADALITRQIDPDLSTTLSMSGLEVIEGAEGDPLSAVRACLQLA